MQKKLSLLMILLVFATSLAIPAGSVTANGATRVNFTAVSGSVCPGADFCYGGDLRILPNGKLFVVGAKDTIMFTATDDRWTAKCLFSGDPFPPGDPNAYPVSGSFVCTPTSEKYAGGWWEGHVQEVFQPDKVVANWSGKGYGTLDGLLVTTYNVVSSHYNDVPPGTTDAGVITELPRYQP